MTLPLVSYNLPSNAVALILSPNATWLLFVAAIRASAYALTSLAKFTYPNLPALLSYKRKSPLSTLSLVCPTSGKPVNVRDELLDVIYELISLAKSTKPNLPVPLSYKRKSPLATVSPVNPISDKPVAVKLLLFAVIRVLISSS